jgi:hypothetical protein
MVNQSDREAAEYVCLKHHNLRGELQLLQLQYDQCIEFAKNYATRIEEAQEKLEELTLNVDQFFCDALDALGPPNIEEAAHHVGKRTRTG